MTPEILKSPDNWKNATIGKRYDTDNYPSYNKYQCWDYFDYFCRCLGSKASRYCAITGYAGDLFKLFDKNGFSTDFIKITKDYKKGDWLFYNRHVCMLWIDNSGNKYELGQNQGSTYVNLIKLNPNGILGAMRPKIWVKQDEQGVAEKYDKKIIGQYKTTCIVNLRNGPSTDYKIIKTLNKDTMLSCYGYYSVKDKTHGPWYYVITADNITGFISAKYITKIT